MSSVTGNDSGSGFGVRGESATGSGVVGSGPAYAGVVATSISGSGVSAFSDSGAGVLSLSNSGPGVSGESVESTGVLGKSGQGAGVVGDGPAYAGVVATSQSGSGVSAFSDSGAGVLTLSNSGAAVSAQSVNGVGIESRSDFGIAVKASAGDATAIAADSQGSEAVTGITAASSHSALAGTNTALTGGTGITGRSESRDGIGIFGECALGESSIGVFGSSQDGRGAVGTSATNRGVEGSTIDGIGVYGVVASSVEDQPGSGRGVVGVANSATGVEGQSNTGAGVWGTSEQGEGVHGVTNSLRMAAVAGIQLNPRSTGAGVYGEHRGQGPAGFFRGNVVVTGHLEFAGADVAEDFNLALNTQPTSVEPGTVMVIDTEGGLCPSHTPYDRRVAGVVAGAGDFQPGVVLGRQPTSANTVALALIGRVYCKVDASFGPVEVGDLLTTSPIAGHAMKAADREQAFGAILGKALRPLPIGQSLVPILVTLQ